MDKGVLGARNQRAQARIIAAASILAERFGLGEQSLVVQQRDPAVKALLERERVADLLEALVAAVPAKKRGRPRRAQGRATGRG